MGQHYWTDKPWWTVDEASRLLRVNRKTLYDACASDCFPHKRIGPYIKIPAEALRLQVLPETKARSWHHAKEEFGYHSEQLALDLDPACLIPVRRFRNTREVITAWHYERGLYAQKARRTPQKPLYSPDDISLEESSA